MREFNETLYNGFRATYEIEEIYYHNKTEHQDLIIFKNPIFGRMMALDGIVQTTERDEFIYHEMFVHMPLLTHDRPLNVLIIGGGDGGVAREVCRYDVVEKITMVEIDQAVCELSKTYLPNHSAGAFEDSRFELIISDGLDFVKNTKEKFDVILSDSTDPFGPGAALFAESFYEACSNILSDGGILVTQNGVSFLQSDELATTHQRMRGHFEEVKFFQADVPTYIAGNMNYAWGRKGNFQQITPNVLAERYRKYALKTRYFTPDIYTSAFHLPQYLQDVIAGEMI